MQNKIEQFEAPTKRSRLVLDIPPELIRLVKVAAIMDGLTVSQYAEKVLGQDVTDRAE